MGDSRGDEREDRGERKMNEIEETEEVKTFTLHLYLLQGQQALPNCKKISVTRYLCLNQPPHRVWNTNQKIHVGS